MRPASGARIGTQVLKKPAHDERGFQANLGQDPGDHGAGRRLAVGAGNGDGVLVSGQCVQKLLPLDDLQSQPPGFAHLWIVLRYGRRDDDHLGASHLPRPVAGIGSDPLGVQVVEQRRGLHVRTRDRIAPAMQHARNGRQPNAANAHQMNMHARS